MKWIRFIAGCLVFAAMLVAPRTVQACPAWSDAIAVSSVETDENEQTEFPAAMNQSIYLMLGVPYLTLGVVGFMIYRGVKKNDAYRDRNNSNE